MQRTPANTGPGLLLAATPSTLNFNRPYGEADHVSCYHFLHLRRPTIHTCFPIVNDAINFGELFTDIQLATQNAALSKTTSIKEEEPMKIPSFLFIHMDQ